MKRGVGLRGMWWWRCRLWPSGPSGPGRPKVRQVCGEFMAESAQSGVEFGIELVEILNRPRGCNLKKFGGQRGQVTNVESSGTLLQTREGKGRRSKGTSKIDSLADEQQQLQCRTTRASNVLQR